MISLFPVASPPSNLRRTKRRQSRWEAGFSLIEVLVSALLVVLIATATAKALIASSHFSGDQRLRSQADSVANQDQERLRGISDLQLTQLESTSQSRSVTLNGTTFTVTSSASYLSTTGSTGCTSTSAAYYKVASTVTWPEVFSNRPGSITEESVLSRPVSGDLPVVVTDQTGHGLSGVSVQASGGSLATGSSLQTATTDGSGCVLFAGLAAGSYTVNLTDSGYVDPNGNPATPLSSTTSVAATGTSAQTFHLGLGGSFSGTFTSAVGSTQYTGEADGISWSGTGSSYGMSAPQTNPNSAPSSPQRTIATDALFPFSGSNGYVSSYQVWGGRCPQQRPPATYDAYTVSPGASLTQNVPEPLLNVSVTFGGTSVRPGHLKMSFASSTGTSCTDAWSPTIATANSGTGWLANPGQPFADGTTGVLTVCADYTTGGRTYKVTATPTNTNFTAANPVSLAMTTSSTRASC